MKGSTSMAVLNRQLATTARDAIYHMRREGRQEYDIKFLVSDVVLKYCEKNGILKSLTREDVAAIQALVMCIMKEETMLRERKWCGVSHISGLDDEDLCCYRPKPN
jgi:hypothetical protein